MKIIVANSKGGCGKSTLVLSLADVLNDVQIVDTDLQGTIKSSSNFTGRHVPISEEEAKAKYIIYDTPPYHNEEYGSLFKSADIVLIPTKLGFADLLAIKGVVDDLRSLNMQEKGVVIFNEIRKPYSRTYHEIKELFFSNYKDIKKAKTELSNLLGYRRILSEEIVGKAKKEIIELVKELDI